jgi:hypothetical protein
VYVVTAAHFIADLHAALLQGLPLGTAVSRGRNHSPSNPTARSSSPPPLQDWIVPVVYEAVPPALTP